MFEASAKLQVKPLPFLKFANLCNFLLFFHFSSGGANFCNLFLLFLVSGKISGYAAVNYAFLIKQRLGFNGFNNSLILTLGVKLAPGR
jgi:hypothetical protein